MIPESMTLMVIFQGDAKRPIDKNKYSEPRLVVFTSMSGLI